MDIKVLPRKLHIILPTNYNTRQNDDIQNDSHFPSSLLNSFGKSYNMEQRNSTTKIIK